MDLFCVYYHLVIQETAIGMGDLVNEALFQQWWPLLCG